MGSTPDRFPGRREEEELLLLSEASDPTEVGAMRIISGAFRFRDNDGVFNPRLVDDASHLAVDQFTHLLDEDHYGEITRSAGKVTNVYIWTDSGKTRKIRGVTINRSGNEITSVVSKQYDSGGLKETLTMTPVYSAGAIVNWTTARTTP